MKRSAKPAPVSAPPSTSWWGDAWGPAAALAFMGCVFLPLVVYHLNRTSLDLAFDTIATGALIAFICATLCLAMPGVIRPFRARLGNVYRVCALVAMVLILFPNVTGEDAGIEGSLRQGNVIPLLKMAIAFLVLGVTLRYRRASFRILFQSATLVAIVISMGIAGFACQHRVQPQDEGDKAHFTALGRSRNVLVIVLDMVSGFTAREVLDSRPELKGNLTGFTLYPRAVASALNTPAGLCALLTGHLTAAIEVEDPRERNVRILRHSFINTARQRGYKTGYISTVLPGYDDFPVYNEQHFYDQTEISLASVWSMFRGFWISAHSRILPPFLVGLEAKADARLRRSEEAATLLWLARNLPTSAERAPVQSQLALEYLVEHLHVGDADSSLLVFHSKLTHSPWSFSRAGHYLRDADSSETVEHGLNVMVRLMDKLESLGVLTNTLLMVVSDHGGTRVQNRTLGGLIAREDRLDFGYNPLLMVRPPGVENPFMESDMTVWLGDVAATVNDYLGAPEAGDSAYAVRSLLNPSDPARSLALPLFIKPEALSYHSALRHWMRIDVEGQFQDFAHAVSRDVNKLLNRSAVIHIQVGEGDAADATETPGKGADAGPRHRARIEINGHPVSNNTTPGFLVLIFKENGNYVIRRMSELPAWFADYLSTGQPILVVGLRQLPNVLPTAWIEDILDGNHTNVVNVIYANGRPFGKSPTLIIGPGDLEIELAWNPEGE